MNHVLPGSSVSRKKRYRYKVTRKGFLVRESTGAAFEGAKTSDNIQSQRGVGEGVPGRAGGKTQSWGKQAGLAPSFQVTPLIFMMQS